MRLLTHNVLRSPMKEAENGYPLKIEATDVQVSYRHFRERSRGYSVTHPLLALRF